MPDEFCPCGKPLHYTDPRIRAGVEDLISRLGPSISVKVQGGNYMVPRHYIALHGIKGADVQALAERYDWPIASNDHYEGRHRG